MRALIALALLPACTLYDHSTYDDVVDDVIDWPDAWREEIDAGFILDCDQDLPCPAPQPGRLSVCGRVHDVETGARVSTTASATICSVPTTMGACHLWVRFYDALDYAGNPTGATPLAPLSMQYDACGRFAADDLPRPSLGFLAIVTDDAPGTPDDHRATMQAMPVASGQVRARERIHTLRRSTDEAWSLQAGLGPMTFADRGAILALYSGLDLPRPGVTITSNGSVRTADDFYFADTDPSTHAVVDPLLTSTGANGAALMLNSPLVEHSGAGAEAMGCTWSSSLAASVLGVLFVQHVALENTTTGAPCGL